MAGGLVFDAASSNPDGTNPGTALDVYDTVSYKVLLDGLSWPAPQPNVQWASSVDTEGSLTAASKHENRQINMTLLCKTATALTDLEAKLMKIHREGGTLKWTLRDGTTSIIFDLLSLDTYEPILDDGLHVRSNGAFTKVRIVMTAKPYGRGAELDLGDNVETTLPALVFTDTGVKGDIPGLGRLVIDNDDGSNQQLSVIWGIQSRYYSSASSAALFFQAESCQLESGVTATAGAAGASGGGSNVARHTNLPNNTWQPIVTLGPSGAASHIGDFRVYGRFYCPVTNSGIVSVRLAWQPISGMQEIANDQFDISIGGVQFVGFFAFVDLGLVSLPKVSRGTQGWTGRIDAQSTVSGDDLDVDCILLVPVTEGSGRVAKISKPALYPSRSLEVRHNGVSLSDSTATFWRDPESYEGDYLLIPPAGPETRTLRVVVKAFRYADFEADNLVLSGPGDVSDDISAQLFYTPRYLNIPAP